MQIAILGGSFDPPHLGHLLIARQVLERLPIDEVWLMPCYQHDFDKPLSHPSHRLAMTKLLEDSGIKASDFEIKQKKVARTIYTLRDLSKRFPKNRFSFIVGSDQLRDFHKWDEWKNLIKEFSLIIFPREIALPHLDATVKKSLRLTELPKTVIVMNFPDLVLTNISSTIIRGRVQRGLPIDFLVPKKVEEYIKKNNLYPNRK